MNLCYLQFCFCKLTVTRKIPSFPLGKLLYFQSLFWYDLNSEGKEVEKFIEDLSRQIEL